MSIKFWPLFFISLINIFFGLLAYTKNKKSSLNISYAIFMFFVGIWSLGLFMFYFVSSESNSVFWSNFLYFAGSSIAAAFFLVSLSLLGKKITTKIIAFWILLPLIILFIFYFLTPLMIKGVFYPGGVKTVVFGSVHLLFDLHFCTLFILAMTRLLKALKTTSSRKKEQIKYILLSTFIGVSFNGITNVAMPSFFNNCSLFWLGPYITLVMVSIMFYAIVQYKLLDINIVFRKITGYSIAIASLSIIFVITLFLLSRLFGLVFPQQNLWVMLFIVAALAIIFQPIYRLSSKHIDKLFFKGTLPQISAEKERIQEELQRSERLASIGLLASGLIHEIKNPLTPIRAKIELLPKMLPENLKNPDFFKNLITSIPYEIDRINGLLQQLKEFANPSALDISQVNMPQVLDNRLTLLSEVIKQRNIELRKDYHCPEPTIPGDLNKLGQVFLNLFQNAIDAMPQGGILAVSCENSSMPGNGKETVLIKIQDTGFGIPKEDLSRIFDPFFTKKASGTGLGLAVSHQIIKDHVGMIQVESTQDNGTIFYIFLSIENQNIS